MKFPDDQQKADLHALTIQHQLRFDALADEQQQSGSRQIALRAEMLDTLNAMEEAFQVISKVQGVCDPAQLVKIKAENLRMLLRFNVAASEYARELAMNEARLKPLRDTLAAFHKCRSQLRQLGCSAPELIQHEGTAQTFESYAHELNNSPQDPAQN